ncbi:hypothetical protein EIN_337120 [Entamoeba invadens IP1]|uniref:Uncharacterized protein n=1 Tax=Entamoeba invadens IP1 TaxID=370355 RepID=L7FLW9_ENTIV|nr:hypothetical protein EIN_337120 [Entamoeba invadens IP1]ELP87663.1 hypothetical protein EIN_337120 [Entamoeba invadens IP1]|eukprot:XP_004254434.1 hypothetical protein EIN_337120 [Entamoeba invadens IP1]
MLIRFYLHYFDNHEHASIRVYFPYQVIKTPKYAIKLELTDTYGEEKYRACDSLYFRGTEGAIIVYDVTSRNSFESLDYWIDLTTKERGSDVSIVLVANKCDLNKVVTDEEGIRYAERVGYPLVFCSSYTGEGINEVFFKAAFPKGEFSYPDKRVNIVSLYDSVTPKYCYC